MIFMGVDIIQTDKIKFTSYFPPIAINKLLIRNLPVEIGKNDILSSRINYQKTLRLNYNQNSLTFYVVPLAYWGQERHRISYRLINFDDTWITNIQNQPINFSNLAPGTYRLQLRVSDENGNWSKNIREVEITIKPPFWRTIWAIIGYILIIIGIQYFILRAYRKRESRKKEAALLEFEKKKGEELQSYKIEFFTNVAHEFGLYVGRFFGLVLFIGLAFYVSKDFALRYSLVIVALIQMLSIPLAKNIMKDSYSREK